ncbi:MAG TPA: hypothetical protein PLB81_01710, partial [Deltaproteobacteria bacterium]|nr:hypothetical protein [Deltaproteobacteria bacterium]
MKKPPGFNAPFQALKGVSVKEAQPPKEKTAQAKPPDKKPPDESELFSLAMHGVKPIKQDRVTPEPEDPTVRVQAMRPRIRSD